jgi:hypothetical protein
MVSTGGDHSLRERIARGDYVVDPHAVAEAILRWPRSPMLIPAEALERLAVLPEEDEPLPGPDVS